MKLEVIAHQPEKESSRPPLLFVHGTFHAAWCWEEFFLPYFAQAGYPAYALSLRGHGKSEGSSQGTGVAGYLEDIRQVADEIGQPPVIIGHSSGGYLVLKYLEKYPAAGAVVMAAMSPLMPPRAAKILSYPLVKVADLLARNIILTGPRKPATVKKMFYSASMPEEQVRRYAEKLDRDGVAFSLDFMKPERFQIEKLRQIPLLIQAPFDDPMWRQICNEKTARQLDADYQVFRHTAHNMMLEATWQEVADGMLRWLEKLPASQVKDPKKSVVEII